MVFNARFESLERVCAVEQKEICGFGELAEAKVV